MELAFRVTLVIVIIAINGFFAGSEVALLSVRQSRLRQLAAEGGTGAHAALTLLGNPERLLSVVQVGVTLASLGLGWAGEQTVFSVLYQALRPWTSPELEAVLHGVALVTAFGLITYLHVVLGEVIPKNLALDKAEHLAVLVAPTLLVFYRISLPFVYIIERSSTALSHALGLKGEARGGGHSAEELKLVVAASRGHGYMPEEQEDILYRVLDLSDVYVREIMVSRRDIVSISADSTLDEVLKTMIEQQHSRLPVWEDAPEKIIGLLHYKDLLPVWEERKVDIRAGRPVRTFQVRRLMRTLTVVPETKPVLQLLEEFRHGRSHMALVVDEFGTITGLVTVEDVLEQIVGDIADEHDERVAPPAAEALADLELDGATRIRDLDDDFGISLPADHGYETLAGFLLYKLGDIPKIGDAVDFEGRRYTVLAMDRRRIAQVRIEKIENIA
jgi:CBS domain containing-hemolysin-like protein